MDNKRIENRILENTRFNIAMSEFGKGYSIKEKNNRNRGYFKLKRVAVVILSIFILTVVVVQAKNKIETFENRNATYILESISDSITNGYVEETNMEYAYSDGVGLKINSFFMSENDINLVLDFKLDDEINLDGKRLEYAYILYNENYEVYHVEKGTNRNLIKEFIKKNDVKIVNNDIEPHYITGQSTYITYKEDNIVVSELMSAQDYFPKAKKLYIKVIGIGYKTENGRYKSLSNSEWNIQLNIPEKFYLATDVQYKLKNNVKGISLERILVSDTSMTFIATIDGINGNHHISILDENGKEYTAKGIFYNGTKGERVTTQFPINKSMLTTRMYLKTYIHGEEKMIEMIKK